MLMNLLLYATAAVLCLIGMRRGWKRGFLPSLIRLAFVLLSAVAAFFIARPISDLIGTILVTYHGEARPLYPALGELLLEIPDVAVVAESSETAERLLLLLPQLIGCVLCFVFLFFAVKLLLLPFSRLVSRWLSPETKNGKKVSRFRLGGLLVGLIQSAFCFAVIMVLFFGAASVCDSLSYAVRKEDGASELSETLEDRIVTPIENCAICRVYDKYQIRGLCMRVFRTLGKTEFDGEEIFYFDTAERLLDVAGDLRYVFGKKFPEISADAMKAFADASETVGEDPITKKVLTECVAFRVKENIPPSYADVVSEALVFLTEQFRLGKEKIDFDAESAAFSDWIKVMENAADPEKESLFYGIGTEQFMDHAMAGSSVSRAFADVAGTGLQFSGSVLDGMKLYTVSQLSGYTSKVALTGNSTVYARVNAIALSLQQIFHLY